MTNTDDGNSPIDWIRCFYLAGILEQSGEHEAALRWQAKADEWLARQAARTNRQTNREREMLPSICDSGPPINSSKLVRRMKGSIMTDRRPYAFNGSSTEDLTVAEALQEDPGRTCGIVVWSQGMFEGILETSGEKLPELDSATPALTEVPPVFVPGVMRVIAGLGVNASALGCAARENLNNTTSCSWLAAAQSTATLAAQ